MRTRLVTLLTLIMSLNPACKKDSKDSSESESTTDTSDDTTDTAADPADGQDEQAAGPLTVGTLAVSPAQIFTAADLSIATMSEYIAPAVGATAAGQVNIATLTNNDDISCSTDNGEPIDAKDPAKNNSSGNLMDSDPRYGLSKLFCTINGKADNNTSIRGAFNMPKVFGCVLSGQKDLVFDGQEKDFDMPITRACFGSLVDNPETGLKEGEALSVKLKLSIPAADSGWDYGIEINAEGSSYIIYFKGVKDKFLAFTSYSSGTQKFGDDAVSMAINFESGELRYVYRRDITDCDGKKGDELATCFGLSTDEQWQGTSQVALLTKGTLTADAGFSSIGSVEGAHQRVFSTGTAENVTYHSKLFTAKGAPSTGMTQRGYQSASDLSLTDFLKVANHAQVDDMLLCFKSDSVPAKGNCTGNEGISLTADAQTVFFIHPGDARSKRNKEWFDRKPLDFNSITLDNIN